MPLIPSNIVFNTTLRTYRPQEKNSAVAKTKTIDWHNFDSELAPAKILSSLSVRGFMQKQGEYRQQIVDYNNCTQGLKQAANKLTDEYFLEQKKIIVDEGSTTGGLTAFSKVSVQPEAKKAEYDIAVSQLASFQSNDSQIFRKNEPKPLGAGIYTLGFKTGDNPESQVSVYIAEKDNLNRVIQKIGNIINAAGIEVIAQVKDKNEGTYLHLRSKESGANSSFTIRDINGNAAEILGMNNVTHHAANTRYSVNGISKESPNNIILLDGDNVMLNVDGETGYAKITVDSDYDQAIAAVEQFADQYNKLHEILTNSDNVSDKGKKLLAGIEVLITKVKKEDFENIGITIDRNTGLVEIDKEKLLISVTDSPDKVKSLFGDKPGLGSITKSLARTTNENPFGSFVKSPTMLDSIDYGWRWRNIGSLGIMSMGSFAYFNQGMFFDMFV